MVLLSSMITACSGNDDHLITTKEELVTMTNSVKNYTLKKVYAGMSKEELCIVMSDSLSKGLNAAGSSFKAMNTWIREYKDPRLAFSEQTYTTQVATLIMAAAHKTCEPKDLTEGAAQFVAYVQESIKNKEAEDKARKAAKIARLGGLELKKIITEMKGFKYQCISNISTDYDWIIENINEGTLNKYQKNLAESRKCQEEALLKQKEIETAQKARLEKMKADNEEILLKQRERQVATQTRAEKDKADKKAKIATALKALNKARGKIQVLDQSCVKSDYMLNMFQTSEYEQAKKNIIGGYGNVDSYIRAVNQHLENSKCKPL